METAIEKFGKLNILVNNAGINFFTPTETMTEQDYDKILNTNLKSAVFMSQLALPHLIASKG